MIPNSESIRMTLRRLIFKKILDPETIIEEIAQLPDWHLNGPGVVLAAIREHNSYQSFEQQLQWLRGVNSVAEFLCELLNMYYFMESWYSASFMCFTLDLRHLSQSEVEETCPYTNFDMVFAYGWPFLFYLDDLRHGRLQKREQ